MKDHKGEHPFGDAGQVILLVVFLSVWIADSFILHISAGWVKPLPVVFRLLMDFVILFPAFYLFKSGHQAVQDKERPVRILSKGAFRYVRHPLYLSGLLVYLAISVSTGSLLSLAVLMIHLLFCDYIAAFEENLMEIKFGEAYTSYKKRTGKWMPRLFQNLKKITD